MHEIQQHSSSYSCTRRALLKHFTCATLCACPLLLLGCNRNDEPNQTNIDSLNQISFFNFDTLVSIQANCSHDVLALAQERCDFFENTLSRTIEGSDVYRINNAQGTPVVVHPKTADLISKGLSYCEKSQGIFDITIGAASCLWDFKNEIVPDEKELEEATKHIDYRTVTINDCEITLEDPFAKLDLGGIAKGYIADDLADLLKENGCDSACINLGGNVRTLGAKPDGTAWNIGIYDPNDGHIAATYESINSSVVTSGLYERAFTKDGITYWHILDPRTGYPLQSQVASGTIASPRSIDGDGFTKILFGLDEFELEEWFSEHRDFDGYLIDNEDAQYQFGSNPFSLAQ